MSSRPAQICAQLDGRYGALVRYVPGQRVRDVALRLVADQLVFTPLFIPVFFGALHTLEGRPQHVVAAMQSSFLDILKANWLVWVPAQVGMQALIPRTRRADRQLWLRAAGVPGALLQHGRVGVERVAVVHGAPEPRRGGHAPRLSAAFMRIESNQQLQAECYLLRPVSAWTMAAFEAPARTTPAGVSPSD